MIISLNLLRGARYLRFMTFIRLIISLIILRVFLDPLPTRPVEAVD